MKLVQVAQLSMLQQVHASGSSPHKCMRPFGVLGRTCAWCCGQGLGIGAGKWGGPGGPGGPGVGGGGGGGGSGGLMGGAVGKLAELLV